jgi:Bacterial PH domain
MRKRSPPKLVRDLIFWNKLPDVVLESYRPHWKALINLPFVLSGITSALTIVAWAVVRTARPQYISWTIVLLGLLLTSSLLAVSLALYWGQHYVITDRHLLALTHRWRTTYITSVKIEEIARIDVLQTTVDRLFGTGQLSVRSEHKDFVWPNVPEVERVRAFLGQLTSSPTN